jgi:hypothetical protein
MKKGGLFVFLLITMINFVSAQGLSELLNRIDQSTVLLFGLFIIAFALLFFSLNKVFKGNTSISGIISIALSFLIVYWINKSGFDVEGSLYDLGINSNILYTLLPIAIAAIIIFLIIKFKKNSLVVIGILLILLSFVVHAKTLLIILGIILIVVRFAIKKGKWEPEKKETHETYKGMGPF